MVIRVHIHTLRHSFQSDTHFDASSGYRCIDTHIATGYMYTNTHTLLPQFFKSDTHLCAFSGYRYMVMVGDGATDLEARCEGGANVVIGYGGT